MCACAGRLGTLIGSISGVSGRLDSPVVALFPCVSDASEESNEASDMADQLGRARSLKERREDCSDFLDGVRCLGGGDWATVNEGRPSPTRCTCTLDFAGDLRNACDFGGGKKERRRAKFEFS
jgi:hypothetical protein